MTSSNPYKGMESSSLKISYGVFFRLGSTIYGEHYELKRKLGKTHFSNGRGHPPAMQ